jgi:integrase
LLAQSLQCPECGSNRIWKAGLRHTNFGEIQRYICRDCGFRFSDPEFSRKITNSSYDKQGSRQICALETKRVKNLVKVEPRTETSLRESNTKGQIVSFAWHLKKLGRADSTIKTYSKHIKKLAKHRDLNDPEIVKSVIASIYKDNNTKRLVCCAYDSYLKFSGGQWEKPEYKPEHKQVFIPTEEELRQAINTGHKESIVFSKFLYETGARSNEAQRLEWTDLDPERKNVTIKASKNGNARTISISKNLMDLLFSLPKPEEQQTVFTRKPRNTRSSSFHNRMKRLAKIHNNPRIEKIHFHTFRHCKALREYHKTRDLLHVMVVLGHRKIETTYMYLRLYRQIYKPQQPNQFITKIGSTMKERIELLNDGWILVEKDRDDWYFKKPKIC